MRSVIGGRLKKLRPIVLPLGVLVLGFVGGYAGSQVQDRTQTTTSPSEQRRIVSSQSQLISSIAQTISPSVVSVNVSVASTSYSQYFGGSQREERGAGTGIVISKDMILTNRHVVPEGTSSVSITLHDGTELTDVAVLGRTAASDSLDVAILKINNAQGKTLVPVPLGDSSKVAIGDPVVAIGNALGQFQNTVTSGIISGHGRNVTAQGDDNSRENLEDLFQTDAAINQGNSGGPLLNLNGEVIGINTAMATDSQNIGFAITINDVSGLVQHALKTGKFEQPYLGVRYVSLTADIAKQYDVKLSEGAYIPPSQDGRSSVVDGSPAAKAGLKPGDVIVKVGQQSVGREHGLRGLLGRYQPGQNVSLTVHRDGKQQVLTVVLGVMP